MFSRLRTFVLVSLVALALTACAAQRQQGAVEVYDQLTFTYDNVARTLARTCVYHDVPKEKCDEWGRLVNQSRSILLEMGNVLDQLITVSANPNADPECQRLMALCAPTDVNCLSQARRACLQRYYEQFWQLQRTASDLLRKLYNVLAGETKKQ